MNKKDKECAGVLQGRMGRKRRRGDALGGRKRRKRRCTGIKGEEKNRGGVRV